MQAITRFQGLTATFIVAATLSISIYASTASASGRTVPPPPVVVSTTTTTVLVVPSGVTLPFTTTLGSGPFTETFALVNTGTIPLVINTVAFSASAAEYTLSGAGAGLCSSGTMLPAGPGTALSPVGANVCTVTVTYMPSALGFSTPPRINFTFGNSAAQVAAFPSTDVLSPNSMLVLRSPTSITFPDTHIGLSSGPVSFTIRNEGGVPLVITNVTVSGDSADFVPSFFRQITRSTVLPSCTTFGNPITVTTFGSCGFIYAFVPTITGARSATVTITTNDPVTPVQVFTMGGNGLPALPPPVPVAAFNVTDEWISTADTALVFNIIHHAKVSAFGNSDAVVATIDTLDAGAPVWYVIKGGAWTSTTSYTADVKDAAGTVLGSATLSFSSANVGTLAYTVNGVAHTADIARAAF